MVYTAGSGGSDVTWKGAAMMELVKVTPRGQITIPVGIREKLGVKDGDNVVFVEEDGRIVMENAAMAALRTAQESFRGEASRLGLKSEQDVVGMIKEVRRARRRDTHACHVGCR